MVSLRSGRKVASPRARVAPKRKVQSPRAPSPSRVPIPRFLLDGPSSPRAPVVKRRKGTKGTKRVKTAVRKPKLSPKRSFSPGFLARIYAMNH